jgi:hypothetical protein
MLGAPRMGRLPAAALACASVGLMMKNGAKLGSVNSVAEDTSPIRSVMSTLYQVALSTSPSMAWGFQSKPACQVLAVSGRRLGLPPARMIVGRNRSVIGLVTGRNGLICRICTCEEMAADEMVGRSGAWKAVP